MKGIMKKRFFVSLTLALVLMVELIGLNYSKAFAKDSSIAEFIFVIDSTGSMEEYIDNVKKNLSEFVTELSKQGIDLRMAVIDYKDVTDYDDGKDSTVVHTFGGSYWTNNVNDVIDTFNSISVYGGGDDEETPTEAMNQAINKLKTVDEWKTDGHKTFMFLLTDADYKESVDSPSDPELVPDMDVAVNVFRQLGINTTVVSKMENEERYRKLYSLTGGKFIDIESENYFTLMQEVAEWVVDTMVDSDDDGIPDEWEKNGVTIDGVYLDFPHMGADPAVPDVFVEADWMETEGDSFDFLWIHSKFNKKNTSPTPSVLKSIYEEFKSHGINIHIDAGPDSVMNYETGEKWGTMSGAGAISYQKVFHLGKYYEHWNQLAMDNFTRARWTTFRYCVFVNQYDADDGRGDRSSGIAENIPGQFFIVASGMIDGSESSYNVAMAGTIMHELGHTLGLSHGGLYYDEASGTIKNNHRNYKPNHLSIMNYCYQFSGLRTVTGNYYATYQRFSLPEIDEKSIDESKGVDPEGVTAEENLTIKLYKYSLLGENIFKFISFKGKDHENIANSPIDFNQNGKDDETISYNVNHDYDEKTGAPIIEELTATMNEWDNLKYYGGLITGKGDELDTSEINELVKNHEMEDELNELSVDEAFELGLLGDEGDCAFSNVNEKVLCNGLTEQTIDVDIVNKYPDATEVNLVISSPIFANDYAANIAVSEDGAKVSVPVKNELEVGEYNISYTMTLANESTVTENGIVKVVEPEKFTMNVGDQENIPAVSDVSCLSSNSGIVEVTEDRIVAKAVGSAYLTVVSEDTYFAKIDVVEPAAKEETVVNTEMNNVTVANVPNASVATGDGNPYKMLIGLLVISALTVLFGTKMKKVNR